jgi:regulator of protease activity HflC (stomatin/prohibitin superfamily)
MVHLSGSLIVIGILAFLVILTIFLGVRIVPQGYKHVVQRLGKYHSTLNPGLNFVIPYLDAIAYKVLTKDISMDIPTQEVITRDNAVIMTNALAFINVIDPQKAVYGIDDFRFAIVNLIQTSLRSIVGEMDLDDALSSRDVIKAKLKGAISDDVAAWGIVVKTVEIQDIKPSSTMQMAMEQQASAERTRRAAITEAEGKKAAAILNAEGAKEAAIREAEGKLEASRRDAEAKVIMAEATREAIARVTAALGDKDLPALYLLGERYIEAVRQLAQSPNAKTLVLPADVLHSVQGILGRAKP